MTMPASQPEKESSTTDLDWKTLDLVENACRAAIRLNDRVILCGADLDAVMYAIVVLRFYEDAPENDA